MGGSVSQSVSALVLLQIFPPICPQSALGPHIGTTFFNLVIFHTHTTFHVTSTKGAQSLAIPRVSHNMPKTFINLDLKHFWECQGFGGGKQKGAKGRLGEIFVTLLLYWLCQELWANFGDNATNIGAGIGYIGLGFIGSLILTKIDFALESYVNLDW